MERKLMTPRRPDVMGWDIGGVHTKAVQVYGGDPSCTRAISQPFEIWRQREELLNVLRQVADAAGVGEAEAMAVTMTAELSDTFRNKRGGVMFVLQALAEAFPHSPLYLLSLDGDFVPLTTARERPLDFAAANWLASALFVARHYTDCILMDIGSTTTDIIPIQGGQITGVGRSDTARLSRGELVYTGVVRTNPNTIVTHVPLAGRMCRVAAEYFSVMGDVYLLLGHLSPTAYSTPTPDGRPKSIPSARGRLARLVCADDEQLSAAQIQGIARYMRERQIGQISEALFQVCSRLPKRPERALVAAGAVTEREGSAYLFVVEEGVAHRRQVTVAEEYGNRVAISEGLEAGERYVAGRVQGIREGRAVTSREAAGGNRRNG